MNSLLKRIAWIAFALAFVAASPLAAVAQEEHAAEAEHHDDAHQAAEKSPSLLSFQPDLAIFSLIVFLLLLGTLSWFAWPQIAAALDEREQKISGNIAAAEAHLEEAKKVLATHEAKLAAAAGEVREMLEEARRDADHTRKSIEDKGRQAAKEEMDRAVREVERARDAAVQELATQSANVAVDLARQIIRDKLTPDHQGRIVRDALDKFSTASPSKN